MGLLKAFSQKSLRPPVPVHNMLRSMPFQDAYALAMRPDVAEKHDIKSIEDLRKAAPGFTLRGGTNEILRGIVARELGVR